MVCAVEEGGVYESMIFIYFCLHYVFVSEILRVSVFSFSSATAPEAITLEVRAQYLEGTVIRGLEPAIQCKQIPLFQIPFSQANSRMP